ncbi:MAG: zinc ABC transporter substrate-binding protein [Spirochaetes bacterium]|nr:zinc ABC transporter substrate-binding protein [Spirochaetota bacterium]
MKNYITLFLLLAFILSCSKERPQGRIVLAGTTMIISLVRDLDPDLAIMNLVPPGQCPGHFDLKPSDALSIRKAAFLMIHPFQKYLVAKIQKINPLIKIHIITSPDLTVPENYFSALKEMETILSRYFPDDSLKIKTNREQTIKTIQQTVEKERSFLERIKKKRIKVIASAFQKGFCEYLGLEVIATFAGLESSGLKQIEKIRRDSKREGIDYIISNRTGDHHPTALVFEKRLNKKIIIFANFPDFSRDPMFLHLWSGNLEQLKKGLEE